MNDATVRLLIGGAALVMLSLLFGGTSDVAGGWLLIRGAGAVLFVVGLIGWVVGASRRGHDH